MIRGGLIDVVSHVPPETVGRSDIYLKSVGEATLVIEISDSESNAPLVRIVDRRAAGSRTAGGSYPPLLLAGVRAHAGRRQTGFSSTAS